MLTAACGLISCNNGGKQELSVTNNADISRPDDLIVFSRQALEDKAGSVAPGQYVQVKNGKGEPVVVQYDDRDGDGEWDEAAWLYSFEPKEAAAFSLEISDAPATVKAVVRAHARHMRKTQDNTFGPDLRIDSVPPGLAPTDFTKVALPPFLTEGPSWENDKVGFRLYFDVRNGKDIWGKTTTAMVLDEVGADSSANYHQLADWGMDVLKVGKSLGAGALALQVPAGDGKDTLVRLGGINMGRIIYEKIADGPVRAIIRLHYPEWKIAENLAPVSLTEEISIWGGQYFYESKVTVKQAPEGARLVTGIVNLHSQSSQVIDTAGCTILYTYDVQTENKDNMGMAVLMSNRQEPQTGAAPNSNSDVLQTYTISASLKQQPVVFRFYAGWEKSDSRFASAASFSSFLKEAALQYSFGAE